MFERSRIYHMSTVERCRNGHIRTPENTRVKRRRNGYVTRICNTCRRNWNRRVRGSALEEDVPTLTRQQAARVAFEAHRLACVSKTTASAEALWDVYCAQQNGNKKRPTCRHGHPKVRENVTCRWTKAPSGKHYVRAECRICACAQAKKWASKKKSRIDVFVLVRCAEPIPQHASEKERERIRIQNALRSYGGVIKTG